MILIILLDSVLQAQIINYFVYLMKSATGLCFRVFHLFFFAELSLLVRLNCSKNRQRSSIQNFQIFSRFSNFSFPKSLVYALFTHIETPETRIVPLFEFGVKSERLLVKQNFRWSSISEWTSANIRKTRYCRTCSLNECEMNFSRTDIPNTACSLNYNYL